MRFCVIEKYHVTKVLKYFPVLTVIDKLFVDHSHLRVSLKERHFFAVVEGSGPIRTKAT